MRQAKIERYKRQINDLKELVNEFDKKKNNLKDKRSTFEEEIKEWKRKVSILENSSSGIFRSERVMYEAQIKEIKKKIEILDDSIDLIEKEKKRTNSKINKLIIKAGCRSEIIEKSFEEEIKLKKEYINDFLSLEEIKDINGETIIDEHGINISYVAFENYFHIQWEKTKLIPKGRIKIYRNIGGFSREEFNEKENSIMIVDSKEDIGVSKDGGNDILRNMTYYYTVMYNVTEENKIIYDTEGIKTNHETVKKNEKPYSIATFKLILLERPKPEEPEKSKIEALIENQLTEREAQVITRAHKRKQMFIDLEASVKNERSAKEYITSYKEKLLNEIKESKGRISKSEREDVDQIVEDLKDRANFLLSEMD
jgi:hypothetical protein